MYKHLLSLLFICFSLSIMAQTKTEDTNRAVFNKLEFFINTQMTDSIYHLANPAYQEKISADQSDFILQRIYPLGRITQVAVEDFKGTTATYRLSFTAGNDMLVDFSIDSTYHYNKLDFRESEEENDSPAVTETIEQVEPNIAIVPLSNTPPLHHFIDSVANSYIKKTDSTQLSVGIFNQNKYETFLYDGKESKPDSLASHDSLYAIGSLDQIFTATLLADLVTKNRIQLDDKITAFLPDSLSSSPILQGVTFQMLANHTAGLPGEVINSDSLDQAQLYAYIKQLDAVQAPGEAYVYSPIGYHLLKELIANIQQKPYAQCLQETILTPLQLKNTNSDDQGVTLKSNLRDLMLFAIEQFKMPENDLQKAMALTRVFTFYTPDNTDIGLAWHMRMLDGIIYLHQSGQTTNSNTFMAISPDTKSALIVLSNTSESVAEISQQILAKLLQE